MASGIAKNIISIGKREEAGNEVSFKNGRLTIIRGNEKLEISKTLTVQCIT